jgi:hypothetical protein
MGLGAAESTPKRAPILNHSATLHRQEHKKWIPAPAAVVASAAPGYDQVRRREDVRTGDLETICEEEIGEEELTHTPVQIYTDHALYLSGVTLLHRTDRKHRYRMDVATLSTRTLSDTGAQPSIVTTGLLAGLPKTACVEVNPDASYEPLVGPDGNYLKLRGKATIRFDLHGTPCVHTFVVVEGQPLLLFGNDFLGPRKARISMNEDGKGNGTITLTSKQGSRMVTHRAPVTSSDGPAQVFNIQYPYSGY